MKTTALTSKADYIGITGSFLCLIHCLATPILLVSSAWLKQSEGLRNTYLSLDYVFIGVNIIAVYFATRNKHATKAIRVALWASLAVFTVAILFEEQSEIFEYMGYAASLGLITTHIFNIRYCSTHGHTH
jgi:succinate dehydrogenase/fumarate reductase cytochrome b subunit